MPLRTSRLLALCIEPPGPIRRELSLYRRRLFEATGLASARAFPELAFLGLLPPPEKAERIASLRALRAALPRLWRGVAGRFSAGAAFLRGEGLYLSLEGPLPELRSRAAEELGLEAWPLLSDRGFFLLRRGTELGEAAALELAASRRPPEFGFFSARLLLLELALSEDPFRGQSWRELGSARRLAGPPLGKGRARRGEL